MILDDIREKARAERKRIVLADSDDRVEEAIPIIRKEGLAEPLTVQHTDEEMIRHVCKRRDVKAEEAEELLKDPYWRAAAMVATGKADGMVAGATRPTEDTLRAVLRLLLKNDFMCSCFLMCKDEHTMLFSDCAMNPMPDAERLAQIAIMAGNAAEQFGLDPQVAMLSFSTLGSSKDENAERVRKAVSIARAADRTLDIEGELQFDAAYIPSIGRQKGASGKKANVYVFPSLDAGNIAYKITERIGGYRAIGPVLLGLEKPANDLSRGCSVQDIVDVTALTAVQAQRS